MRCFTTLAIEAVSKLGEMVVESTVKQFEYLIHHNKIMANLKDEHEKLNDTKQALQKTVDINKRNGLEIAPNVQKWLDKVEAVQNEFQRFYENEANKNKKCFGGQCPDLAFNYSMGKQATKMTKNIVSLKKGESKLGFISNPESHQRLGFTFIDDIIIFESRKTIITEVMEKLKDDRFRKISICGMGGVGKTTMVKELIKIIEIEKVFDKVVMVVVSENPNYEKIQCQIAVQLGLEFKRKSTEGRANELLDGLNKINRVLIVLDDVWDVLDFERIGLPSNEHQKGCKILFTSRNEEVCSKMESQENFPISTLPFRESWDLLRHMAGGEAVNEQNIHPIAVNVTKECGGLPLAIVTVGRALANTQINAWESALEQLRNPQPPSFSDMQECVYSSIQRSYNFLGNEELKSCILLCGLFKENFNIPIENLFRHGVGLGLFKAGGALWKARNQVHTLVNNLKRCFLLLDSQKPGCVKMHNVVRNAIRSASREEHGFVVQHYAKLKWRKEDNMERVNAISLILEETMELENGLECPTLELLQVQPNSGSLKWFEHFFHGMSRLKVLAMRNLHIQKFSFQTTINLHTLQLEDCDVGDISVIGKELMKLEILSFAYSNIKVLPTEIGQLGMLRLLDLTECNNLNFIYANVFMRLSRLEELYMRIENFPWKENSVVLIELKNMAHQLKVVEMAIREVEILPKDLDFKNLEKFWVYVAPSSTGIDQLRYLDSNILQVMAIDYNSIKGGSMIIQLIKKCEVLVLGQVKKLKNVIKELDDSGLQNLKDLRLDSIPDLEYLIDFATPCNAFPHVQSLSLKKLDNLREICNVFDHLEVKESMIKSLLRNLCGNVPHGVQGFQNLRSCIISKCDSLKHVFTLAIVSVITKLEKLEIENCKLMENIVVDSRDGEKGDYKDKWKVETIKIDKLDSLTLSVLPNIVSICAKPYKLELPSLRKLCIDDCPKLSISFLPQDFQEDYSRSLQLECRPFCSKITLLTHDHVPSISERKVKVEMGRMPILEELHVRNINLHDKLSQQEGDQMRIRHGPVIDGYLFPNLTSLTMQNCSKISVLFSPSSSRSLERLEKLNLQDCENIEEIVSQEEVEASVNKIMFLELQHLLFQDLANLKAFCQGSYNFDFPSLQKVEIKGCPNMEIFSRGPSHTPKLENVIMEIKPHSNDHIQNRDLNATIQGFKAFVAFSEMLMGSNLDRESLFGYIKNSQMDIITFGELLKLVPFNEINTLQHAEIFESEREVDTNKRDATFHMTNYELRYMYLIKLPKLMHLWNHSVWGLINFHKLTSINVENCSSLKILFSLSMARSLVKLRKLSIRSCKLMEKIITKVDENTKGSSKVENLFPTLKRLELQYLPALECFYSGDYDYGEDKEQLNVEISFPELEELYLYEVPSLKCFCSVLSSSCKKETIEGCPQSATFPNGTVTVITPNLHYVYRSTYSKPMLTLEDLNLTIYYIQNSNKYKVKLKELETLKCIERDERLLGYITRETRLVLERCDKLLNCVPSNMMHIFQHLITLKVRECANLEEIFESQGVGTNEYEGNSNTRMLYKLYLMELHHLPKLKQIWKIQGQVLGFQNLKYLTITSCNNLKSVFPLSIITSLPELWNLNVSHCNNMEEIIQNHCVEEQEPKKAKIIFPRLHKVQLEDLPCLNCFCRSTCDFELPLCRYIMIEKCPMMETFCYGAPYTPAIGYLLVENRKFDKEQDINEVIKQTRDALRVPLPRF